jgi:hypothetical protein
MFKTAVTIYEGEGNFPGCVCQFHRKLRTFEPNRFMSKLRQQNPLLVLLIEGCGENSAAQI